MIFQLVALANYPQKLCVKMNTVDNIKAASLVSLSIEITTKKKNKKKIRPYFQTSQLMFAKI